MTPTSTSANLARCDAEISHLEALLRAGHPDLDGLLLALSDWSQEKRLIQGRIDRRESDQ
jgi:hypothetical protein